MAENSYTRFSFLPLPRCQNTFRPKRDVSPATVDDFADT